MIGVIGGGAFGTALAIALSSDGTDVRLWMRKDAEMVQKARQNARRLPEIALPKTLTVTGQLDDLNASQALLLALPAQQTASFLTSNLAHLPKVPLLLCAKGIALDEMKLQSDLVMDDRSKAILTGPGFAGEIASGLPTALTLASQDDGLEALQELLSRPKLRLYRERTGRCRHPRLCRNVPLGPRHGCGKQHTQRSLRIGRSDAELRFG